MIAGNAAISRDVPPQVLAAERNLACGLNLVGLRRRKTPAESIGDLKHCYAAIYRERRSPAKLAEAAFAEGLGHTAHGRAFLEFYQKPDRKFCRPREKHS